MKSLNKLFIFLILIILLGCQSQSSLFRQLNPNEIDQKSYAIAYSSAIQTYNERIYAGYDIKAFTKGANDWYLNNVAIPVEQIRASLMNRMLDHDIYAYYSGALFAADLQINFNRLSLDCWKNVDTPSMTQGIYDALSDLKNGKIREDKYITEGEEQWLALCVKQVEKNITR